MLVVENEATSDRREIALGAFVVLKDLWLKVEENLESAESTVTLNKFMDWHNQLKTAPLSDVEWPMRAFQNFPVRLRTMHNGIPQLASTQSKDSLPYFLAKMYAMKLLYAKFVGSPLTGGPSLLNVADVTTSIEFSIRGFQTNIVVTMKTLLTLVAPVSANDA